ncbi:P-loop containing nucleoside triphosphate hydrolase protein, partial [Mycena olivaceomarginata]
MPSQPTASQVRLNNITTCLMMTINALQLLATNFDTPFLQAISNTTQSLLDHIQAVKQNKDSCVQLMEQTYTLINAIIVVHGNSATSGVLPPTILENIGKFTETLHKIHTFVEAQRAGNKIKKFLRQGELSMLFKDCQSGLKQGLDFFQIGGANIMTDLSKMRQEAEQRNQEVLRMIGELSDTTSSDGLSMTSRVYSGSRNSSTSISMLPSEPKIFHGRDSELSDILQLFNQGTPRIAILGSGGMGKTSLARAVIHHAQIKTRYQQHCFFVACDSASSTVELAALIGVNIGLKPGRDLSQAVVQHFSSSPSSLLVLDNLETLWEPMECRSDIEEFLSLLADIEHLALMITMRGAERPGKMQWTRPFLQPLKPLDQDAARKTFIDIADENHNLDEVDKVLSLTDNMPLAVSLIAHLVDSEGCPNVLARWEREKISVISLGTDKEANLEISISLSLSSPRLNRHSRDLLSLLSMLPDGLSDVELVQSKLPIRNVLGCKAALIGTALAYSNEQKRLKALVPIREYMNKIQPPSENLIRPLFKHFQFLLKFFEDHRGSEKVSATVSQISSNLANIQNILHNGLQQGHPELNDTIYSICHLNVFSRLVGQGITPLIHQVHNILPHSEDHHLRTYVISELLQCWRETIISDPDTLVTKGLNHFEHFDDPDLKCRFYICIADYYQGSASDLVKAIEFCQAAVSLAHSTGNTKRHSEALCNLASMNERIGDYSTAQLQAFEAQRLARISANLLAEAHALNIQAKCLKWFGDYSRSVSTLKRSMHLLGLCGLSGGRAYRNFMIEQADIHM